VLLYLVIKYLVSIHVPLAEHDGLTTAGKRYSTVSIHVPLAEHDTLSRWNLAI